MLTANICLISSGSWSLSLEGSVAPSPNGAITSLTSPRYLKEDHPQSWNATDTGTKLGIQIAGDLSRTARVHVGQRGRMGGLAGRKFLARMGAG